MMSEGFIFSFNSDNGESPSIFTAISKAFNFWSKVKMVFCFILPPLKLSVRGGNGFMNYFFFFAFFVVCGSAAFFGGRPFPGTSFIASKSSSVYSASCEKGLRLARKSLRLIVSLGNFNFSAISEIVIPCISPIIGSLDYFLKNVHKKAHLHNKRLAEIENNFKNVQKYGQLCLTKCSYKRTI